MSDETKVETTEAPAGMAALGALSEDNAPEAAAAAAPAEPKVDNLGRSYATGRRKDAAAEEEENVTNRCLIDFAAQDRERSKEHKVHDPVEAIHECVRERIIPRRPLTIPNGEKEGNDRSSECFLCIRILGAG